MKTAMQFDGRSIKSAQYALAICEQQAIQMYNLLTVYEPEYE